MAEQLRAWHNQLLQPTLYWHPCWMVVHVTLFNQPHNKVSINVHFTHEEKGLIEGDYMTHPVTQ